MPGKKVDLKPLFSEECALMEHLLEGTLNEINDWAHRCMYNIYLYIILVAIVMEMYNKRSTDTQILSNVSIFADVYFFVQKIWTKSQRHHQTPNPVLISVRLYIF